MKITKHQANDKGIIRINNVVRLLTMGLQDNVPTIWAVTDPLNMSGMPMSFMVKNDGDQMTIGDCNRYITSFISNEGKGVFHLIGEEQKIVPASMDNPRRGDGPQRPSHDPRDGKILV